jgi:hypothetical protein
MCKTHYSQKSPDSIDLSDHLEKKRHPSKKKLVAIIVGSAFLVVGMTTVSLVSHIWKKKFRNQGKFVDKKFK